MEFFSGAEIGSDAADTTKGSVGVLDKTGNVRLCAASGTRIFFPNIPGVGVVRQRYPIMPVAGEGSQVWKELEATKDLILKSKTYGYVFREPLQSGPAPTEPPKPLVLQMQDATTGPGPHKHDVIIQPKQIEELKAGKTATITTGKGASHHHVVTLKWDVGTGKYVIYKCDSTDKEEYKCWDKHPKTLGAKTG